MLHYHDWFGVAVEDVYFSCWRCLFHVLSTKRSTNFVLWQALVMFLSKTLMIPYKKSQNPKKINSICLFSENAFWSFINRKKNDESSRLCCREIQRIYEKIFLKIVLPQTISFLLAYAFVILMWIWIIGFLWHSGSIFNTLVFIILFPLSCLISCFYA